MKTSKRIIAVALMVMMLASVLVFPASAAGTIVQQAWSQLPTIGFENYYTEPHVALQRFLQVYSPECEKILAGGGEGGNGGVDGYFGSHSVKALTHFQKDQSLQQDGRAGPKTRERIAILLHEKSSMGLCELSYGDNNETIYYLLHNFGDPSEAIYILRNGSQGTFYTWY